MAKKEINFVIPMEVSAGSVAASGPIATTLGPKGVNLGLVVKSLNDLTADFEKDAMVRVELTVYDDKSIDFRVLGYALRHHILKAAGVSKGSQKPGREMAGSITKAQAMEIVKQHIKLLNTTDEKKALYILEGSAKSMGIAIK